MLSPDRALAYYEIKISIMKQFTGQSPGSHCCLQRCSLLVLGASVPQKATHIPSMICQSVNFTPLLNRN